MVALGAYTVAANTSNANADRILSKSDNYNRHLDSVRGGNRKRSRSPRRVRNNLDAPPLPGVAQHGRKEKIILAQDISYPPYAFLGVPPEGDYELAGIVVDIVKGMNEICDLEIVTVQT